MGSNLLASCGLCSSMLNGPRIRPKTPSTSSTTLWCSAGTSSLPVIGGTRGMFPSPTLVIPGLDPGICRDGRVDLRTRSGDGHDDHETGFTAPDRADPIY